MPKYWQMKILNEACKGQTVGFPEDEKKRTKNCCQNHIHTGFFVVTLTPPKSTEKLI